MKIYVVTSEDSGSPVRFTSKEEALKFIQLNVKKFPELDESYFQIRQSYVFDSAEEAMDNGTYLYRGWD